MRDRPGHGDRLAAFIWVTLILVPLLVIVAWNVGVASIAHITVIHSYWAALGITCGLHVIKWTLSSVAPEDEGK